MRKANPTSIALAALLLSAVLFASAPVLAQDHGHAHDQTEEQTDDHGTEHAVDAAHGEGPAHGGPHGDEHAADEHGDAHGDDHGGDHDSEHSAMPHLPNALTFMKGWSWFPKSISTFLYEYKDPVFSIFMASVLAIFFIGLSRQLNARKPGRRQMAAEMLLGGLNTLFESIIGPTARRYTPFLGSLFIFIYANNLFGLIPLGHASTSSFANTTFALGLMTFVYVQFHAIRMNGIGGWLYHLAGSPKDGLGWGLVILFFPLHLVGELIKPLSLSLRLFGNIFGEDTLVATMVLLGAGITFGLTGSAYLPGLPLQFPFYFLGLLSCTIQALVFTLLATVYIALWLPHHDHDHAEAH